MRYKNKKEFVKELGYCVDYLNFTTPVDKRVPIEMLVGQAVLESGWGMSRFAKEQTIYLVSEYLNQQHHTYYH